MSFFRPYMESLDISLTHIYTAIALILLSIVYCWIKNRNVLPGPKGLPYLGLYPFLSDENFLIKMEEYKKKYGDMFSFTFSGRLFINLGSIKAMREIQLQKSDCFGDRYKGSIIIRDTLKNGLFLVNGEQSQVLRKFFIQKFKEYGLNTVRDDLAGPVYDSLNAAIENLKIMRGKPVNIVDFLSQHCTITMRKLMFGQNGVTDQEISNLVVTFVAAFEGFGGRSFMIMGPLAKFLSYTKPSYRKNLKHHYIFHKTILDCVKRIKSSMVNDEATCIVEEFYKERNKRKRNNDTSWRIFSDEAIAESLFQLVGDGIASVAAFITGILTTLLDYPEEQEKLYSEIMEVVGQNRHPAIEDRPHLPYTNAFLNECVRTSQFLPFFPSLECTKETTVRGYRIPTGTITLLNFWSANNDEGTFQDPHLFKPSRYLHGEGKPKVDSPVLFGMGKRICTGEQYVMLQSFLFLTTIVKYFKVVSSNASNDKTLDTLLSGNLELTFVQRKEI